MDMKKAVLIQSVVLGVALALPVSAAMPQQTVADCVERTGRTEADCAEMIARSKDSRPPEGGPAEQGGDGNNVQVDEDIERAETVSERSTKMRTDRERRYARMQERIGKIITYLDEQGADTAVVKGYLDVFKTKVADILTAYDAYIATLKTYESDGSVANKAAIAVSKDSLRTRIIDASEYYRSTIVTMLRALIDALPE